MAVGSFWSLRLRDLRTSKEAVELHQKLEVDIVALGSFSVAAPNVVAVKVDT